MKAVKGIKMKIGKLTIIFYIFAVLLSACVDSQSNLDGTSWVLITYNDILPIEGAKPTLQFDSGQVLGNTGCNHYGGDYQIKGDAISISDLFRTEMGCMDPEGVMEQERVYLDLLVTAQRFEVVDDVLVIFTDSGEKLIFVMQQDTPEPQGSSLDQPGSTTVATTAEVVKPSPPNTLPLPVGYKEYQDSVVGVSVHIPENWLVTRVIEGETATFQTFPEGKYVRGEEYEPGDAKCELIINGVGHTTEMQLEEYRIVGIVTIFSEEEIVLSSGKAATRLEVDIMGELLTLVVAEINSRVILFQCFGDRSQFETIAATLGASE
jgi:heat shock protein HslJ